MHPAKHNISSIPMRYLPKSLTKKDKRIQLNMLAKSRTLYKRGMYYTRKPIIKSFSHKTSRHIRNAQRIYKIKSIKPSRSLAEKTGCSLESLKKIVQKGEGAYYSSGSRPNQTPQSWGLARLASAITGAKASQVDAKILACGCKKTSKALKLAKGWSGKNWHTRKIRVSL